MSLSLKLSSSRMFIVISVLVAAVIAIFMSGGYLVSKSEMERDFEYEARIYSETFYAMQRSVELELLQESRLIALDPSVQSILSEATELVNNDLDDASGRVTQLRRRLFQLLEPRWRFDFPDAYFHHLHFHLGREPHSFLRMQYPQRFGDKLQDTRHMIHDVVKDLKSRSGFEIGPTFVGIRAVTPVFSNVSEEKQFIGTLETGLSYQTMVNQIGRVSGHDITVLLNRGFMQRIMDPDLVSDEALESTPCGCLVHASSARLPEVVLEFAQRNGRGLFDTSGALQFMHRDGRTFVASFFPLQDYFSRFQPDRAGIGSIVVWQDVTQRLSEFDSAEKKILLLGVLAYLLIEVLLLLALQRVAPGLRMEIKTAAEELEHNVSLRIFFKQILDTVEECVFLIGRETGFEYVNQAVIKRLGYSQAQIESMSMADIDVNFDAPKWSIYWQQMNTEGARVFESVYRDRAGSELPVEITANPIHFQGRDLILAVVRDISARKYFEREMRKSNLRHRSIIATARDGFLAADIEGNVIEVNTSYCNMLGYDRGELLGMRLADIDVRPQEDDLDACLAVLVANGSCLHEGFHRSKNGHELPVEVSASYSPEDDGWIYLFVRDISARKQDEKVSNLRDNLSAMVHQASVVELLTRALDEAEQITGSEIAFYHFVDPGEETLTLQAWSSRTHAEACSAGTADDRHYPVSEAGVWVDSVIQRKPVIYNDYASIAHRKGLPEGHSALRRFVTVPVFRGQHIVAVMGVGNKEKDYDARDVDIIARIADMSYDFARHCETKQHVEFMAYYDMLTGLPNRALFFEHLKQNIAQHDRTDNLLALCYLDLDGFKPVNDDYGHSVGDELLIGLGGRLQSTLREGDTLARIGGDEFLIMLTGLSDVNEAEHIVQRLINETSKPFDIDGKRLYVTASIGVTLYPTDDTNPDTLLRHADQAMYKAKALGKSRYSLYERVEEEDQRVRREIQDEIHEGIKNNEFVLWYQPRVDLSNSRVVGVEALLRWRHPRKGFMGPSAFLPYIEGTADEVALGEWVIKHALNRVSFWRDGGLDLPVSINVSPQHIQNADFAPFLCEPLSTYPEELARMVEIEVLETAAIGDFERVVSVMNKCVETGVSFSLDDFGTGYSSLAYFHRLPVSILKIDQDFVRNILKDAGALEIVKGVVQLAKNLDRPVVAEGVESLEIGLMLLGLGCEYAQGYGIARPMPEDVLSDWLADWSSSDSWGELRAIATHYTCSIELQVAIYSFGCWSQSVIQYVGAGGKGAAPQLNEEQSEFGHWLHGIGRVYFADHDMFPFITPRIALAFKLARDIVAYIDHGDMRSALSLMVVFNNACDELCTKLHALNEAVKRG